MIIRVDDPADERLDAFRWRERQLANVAQRREKIGAGMFVAEGDLVVGRALDAGCDTVALLCDDRHGTDLVGRVGVDTPVYVGNEALRKEVTGLGVPLSATGLFRRPALLSPDTMLRTSRFVVTMEAVDNPTNLGVIVRSAAALGWDGLLLDSTSADPLARRALRVSMGTGLSLPFSRLGQGEDVVTALHRHGFVTCALTPDGAATDISAVSVPHDAKVAVLLGSERTGLSPAALSSARHTVRIPMHAGTDSLNVGAAAAIALQLLGPNSR
jgi:tRNA G18 (ribose-2'-O)-methylase SpoU